MGAGPVWERALPANFFFTAWLTHHPRRGGLRSAADPHPSWVPSFRQEPRSPGSLGAGLLCRFADPPPRGRWVRLTFCATFAGRAFMPTGTLPQEWAHSHTALWERACPRTRSAPSPLTALASLANVREQGSLPHKGQCHPVAADLPDAGTVPGPDPASPCAAA